MSYHSTFSRLRRSKQAIRAKQQAQVRAAKPKTLADDIAMMQKVSQQQEQTSERKWKWQSGGLHILHFSVPCPHLIQNNFGSLFI